MGAILDILASGLSIVKTWFVGKNSPTEIARKEAQDSENEAAKANRDIASGDSKKVGEDIS